MSMIRRTAALALVSALSAACNSNPVLVDDGNLTAELILSTGHAHTLSELGLEVVIRNGDGYEVDDFEAVAVERRTAGSDTWRAIALAPGGAGFTGTYVFMSSGDYDLRVTVTRHGAAEPVEVPLMDPAMGHLGVARAHVEMAGHRVEFETFPGHIHEGDDAEVKFWILEPERDASGMRPPVTGLDVKILCFEGGLMVEEHHAHGHDDGAYEAVHTFAEAGIARAGVVFTDGHGNQVETGFEFNVAHGH